MKEKFFISTGYELGADSTNSGQIVRQLGLGFDFSKPYYFTSLSTKRARFGVSVSRLLPVLAIRSAVSSIGKVVYRLVGRIFDAFGIVLSSPVV